LAIIYIKNNFAKPHKTSNHVMLVKTEGMRLKVCPAYTSKGHFKRNYSVFSCLLNRAVVQRSHKHQIL